MNTKEYKTFLSDCKASIDEKPLTISFDDFDDLSHSVFSNPHKIKQKASEIRKKFIDNIDENLLIFERKFTENGGKVHWCVSYDDFIDSLSVLLAKNKIKAVNTFTSRFNAELGLDFSLKNEKIATMATDGKCAILEPEFGIVNTGSLFSIFNSAFDMEIVMGSKLKIFIIPINKFVCNIAEIDIMSTLLSIYRNQNDSPFLSSIFTPNSHKDSASHVFLIDNGRSNILASKTHRKALWCIDCDACKRVCPVFNTIGDKPYNNVFTGPYANVVLPFYENFDSYKHLSFNSVGCGNCTRVCPVNIPLTDLMIENRRFFFEKKIMDLGDDLLCSRLKKFLLSRSEMNKKTWLKKRKIKAFIKSSVLKNRITPPFAKQSFNALKIQK
ncbi:MAG: 4Fe-4S dicluster domain-containing protein [Bacteroidales bacterium]|jgi:L-lactate dehydrogenase complex protein LldF|nr:4Fe-4S dicluster domain-containing protein [Bacteroidales bacterium]MEE0983333.1 4Fe-4S dicluster domain-containing protein [Bacteroidales bacterium]